MVRLSEQEQNMLSGKEGRLKQRAMENIVRYATLLGTEELCIVTKATVFCGKHNYLNACDAKDFDEMFSKVQLNTDEMIPFDSIHPRCQVQTCVSPCDTFQYKPFSQDEDFFKENSHYLERAKEAGVTIAGTCAPYLNGWIPIAGEHFVTTESGMTILGNSLWGACCNSDGIEAAFWSAICGRTPKWGKHLKECRKGNISVSVEYAPKNFTEWDILGKAIGERLPLNSIPVITGDFSSADFNNIRQFLTAVAASSNCEMCHIVGITPEAPTAEFAFGGNTPFAYPIVITEQDMKLTYAKICDPGSGKIDLVSLGCPHYDIYQIKRIADYIKGKKVSSSVDFQIWTTYPIKHMAEFNGYAQIIYDAGGKIYTSSCPTTIGKVFLKDFTGVVFDSVKQGGSVRSDISVPSYFGSPERCVDAAVSGVWKEEFRWRK